MGKCVFAEEVPQVAIRNGMVFIKTEGHEIATSVANLQSFVAKCNRALDYWHEASGSTVVRFSPKPHS